MKFYDCITAPSPRRVRIFLAEKGLEIPTVQVDLAGMEHLGARFRALNPRCTVPVLELDDGSSLWETLAICHYLESLHPEPVLMGCDALQQAQVLQWNHRVEYDGFLAVAECLRNRARKLEGRALTGPDSYQQIPQLVERGRLRAQRFFRALDSHLAENRYLLGELYTLADITAVVSVDFAARIKWSMPEDHLHLRRWHEEVSARPGVVA